MATVLMVDDSADLTEMIAWMYEHAGVRCLVAHSLAEVQALGDVLKDVTLAILDVNLGRGEPSGVDVDEWLHAQRLEPHVVFLTGHAKDHPLMRGTSGHRVLEKPVDMEVLLELPGLR